MGTTRLDRGLAALAAAWLLAGAGASAESEPVEGLRYRPNVGWRSGDHAVDLAATSRWRWENWDARAPSHSNMLGARTRVSLRYSWQERVALLAEGQHVWITGTDADSSGAAALYRAFSASGVQSSTSAFHLTQLWAELAPFEGARVRLGRQPIDVGALPLYPEPAWKWLKTKRLSQRLVGGVGWTDVERAFDGGSATWQDDRLFAHLFAAEPTTGVFESDQGLRFNHDVLVGGASLTAKRGALLEDAELTAFFVGYGDDRDPAETTGLFGKIEVYTIGANLLAVHPLGPGNVDVLLWAAGQFGRYPTSATSREDHRAWALIAEAGYQLAEVPWKPWLRTGVNLASGDGGGPGGETHRSFFNVLPTNHLYYGYTDQLAFSNLIDWLAQLKLSPLPRLGVELAVHRFWLYSAADFRYFGTGAFDRRTLGYGSAASTGSSDVGTEVDLIVSFDASAHVGVLAGYGYLAGGKAFSASADRDTQWGFVEATVRY